MAKGMAAESVQAKQDRIQDEDQRAKTDSELSMRAVRSVKPQTFPGVVGKDEDKHYGEIQEVPVNILQDQRK